MKIIIAPDSFKGTLSAREVSAVMKQAVLSAVSDAEVIVMPVADGGEGTLDALGCSKVSVTVSGPFFEPVNAEYGVNGTHAVIEMAACAGFPLVGNRRDPSIATTFGVGELILRALDSGCRDITLTLGGSATNDLGCGMAAALGVKFYGNDGEFVPVGGRLSDILRIDLSGMDSRVAETAFTAMCDVTNPLYGQKGAAYVFAPQKGADSEMVGRLDCGLRHAAAVISHDCGVDVSELSGGGAAGGMGAAVCAFLGGSLKRGIDAVLDSVGFDAAVNGAELVLTGEGRFDRQSLEGKVVSGIASRAFAANVPCVVIAGSVEDDMPDFDGVTAAFSIQTAPRPLDEVIACTKSGLYQVTRNAVRLFTARFHST